MTRNRFWLLLCCLMLNACRSLPNLDDRETSLYIPTQSAPQLEQALNLPAAASEASAPQPPETEPSDNLNNTYPADVQLLNGARSAYHARAVLLDNAAVSIDAQYYIWRDDTSGLALLQKLWQAAERGVRVRLLLDDNNTHGMDAILSALNSHPNIQIRLFNPFLYRKWRFIGYLTDFSRLNRRMHNKALIADNRVSIIGGRNIGDEYFKVGEDTIFADLDILATGRVVPEVSQDFDRYWASHSSYTAASIIKKGDIEKGFQELGYNDKDKNETLSRYRSNIESSELYKKMQSNSIDWQSVHTRLISDDPAKGLDRDRHKPPIFDRMQDALKTPEKSVYLVSPYFVPTKSGVRALDQLVKDGVDVTVLTNSLQATDVAAVHSGYVKYRKPLLKAGVKLYELQPNHAVPTTKDRGLTGSSATSLHAKTFIVDEKRVFIGSFNLDPRSARLNTEMGVVLESPKIAGEMQRTLVNTTPKYAYQVTLDKYNKLHWYDPTTQKTYSTEPEAKFWKRVTSKILSILPIEGLL